MKRTKKILALLLAITLLLSAVPMSATAQTNATQPEEHSNGAKAADEPFTRATFAQYIVDTLLGVDLTDYTPDGSITISDVNNNHENYNAIAWCVENNCLSADSGNFNPTGNITRAEVAQAVYDFFNIHDYEFNYGNLGEHQNKQAIAFAVVKAKIMSEQDGLGFRPDDNAKPSDINVDNMPKMLFYNDSKTLSVEAGEYTSYDFSAFTDINGTSLSADDIAALGNINYINSGDSNYLFAYCDRDNKQITVNTFASLPDKRATLFFYDGNDHVKYILDATTAAPEWGVYWTKESNNDKYITSAANSYICLNTYADETVYIVPPKGAALSSVNQGGNNSEVYAAVVENNTVKLTYTGDKAFDEDKWINFTIEYTEEEQKQTKNMNVRYSGTNKLKWNDSDKIVLGVGESTESCSLTIGGSDDGGILVRPNEFTLSFKKLTGVTVTHKNDSLSLGDSMKNNIGATGQLVATSKANDATFTIDVEIDYPLVGLYSQSTKSAESLVQGDIDLRENTDETVTYYLITRDGYTFDENNQYNTNDGLYSYQLSNDKTTLTCTVKRKAIAEDKGWYNARLWLNGRVKKDEKTEWFDKGVNLKIRKEGEGGGNSGNGGNGNYGGNNAEPPNPEIGKIYTSTGKNELNITLGNSSDRHYLFIYEDNGEGGLTRRNLTNEDSKSISISGGFASELYFSMNESGLSGLFLINLKVASGYLVYKNNDTVYTLPVTVNPVDFGIQNPDYKTIYYWENDTLTVEINEYSTSYGGYNWESWKFVVYEPDENGDPVPCMLDGTFEYALHGMTGDVRYCESAYRGYIEFYNSNVRTAQNHVTLTATRNGITHSIPLEFSIRGVNVFSKPDPTVNNFLGRYLYYTEHPEWKTSYVCVPPNSQDKLSNVYVTDLQNGEFKCTLSDDGKYITAECRPLDEDYPTVGVLHYTIGGENRTLQLWASSHTLFMTGELYAREKSVEQMWNVNNEPITSDYKVEIRLDGTSIVLPTKWIDDTSLLVDLTGLDNKYATSHIVATATKGNKTYVSRNLVCLKTRAYSIYSAMPTEEDCAGKEDHALWGIASKYYKAAPGETVTYTDTDREFYLLGETKFGYYPIISAESYNDNIIVEPTYYRTQLGYAQPITGNIAVKITVKDGVNKAQSAKIKLTEKVCAYMSDNGPNERERTKEIIVNFAPDNVEDATFSQGTFAELIWGLVEGAAEKIKEVLEIKGTDDVGAHSSQIRFDGIRNDVTDLKLGEGVGDIGDSAFKDFDKLEKVDLPETTTKIGTGAFDGCENLQEITIPETAGEIDENAFSNTNEDFVIKGGKGDNYTETYAMKHNINYEGASDHSYRDGDFQMTLDKVISCDNRVAVTAKIDNGTSGITGGYAIAAVYYQGQLITTQVIDSEMTKSSINRIVMQLPYLQNIESSQLDVKIMYLNDNKQPAVKSSKKNGYIAEPMACALAANSTVISSTANSPVELTADDDSFSIDYTDVTKGNEYALMIVKADSVGSYADIGEISSESLLYIDQQTAAGTTVSFVNFSLKDNENANVFVADSTGVKHIAYIVATEKESVQVNVSADDITYGETVTALASSSVNDASYSYHYVGTGSTVYDSGSAPKMAGTYKVTATLVSTTHSGSGSATFKISPKNISECTVEDIAALKANGKARTPKLTIKDGYKPLVNDKDFTVVYTNNVDAGTATATVQGIGNYTGTTSKNFTIEPGEGSNSGTGGAGLTTPSTPGASDIPEENVTTLPNGNTVTTEKTDEKTSITVADENGKEIAKIALPAEPGKGKEFDDVKDGAWFKNAVDKATGYGLFNGMTETTFEPQSGMTRGMLAQVLYNLSGKNGYGTDIDNFNDSKGWYRNAVNWAAAIGVVNGTGNGKFDPETEITREQLITMLYRYAKVIGTESEKREDLAKFPDSSKVDDYAKEAMQWAVAEGIILGTTDNNSTLLNPKGTANRAEVATVLVRFVNYLM